MRVAVAQSRPVTGEIQANIARHVQLIDEAVPAGTDLVVFPELSLTGYEPTLAKNLATDLDDRRFDVFQDISDSEYLTIGVGAPIRGQNGICVSTVLFRPYQERHLYSKEFLHADEEPFFVSGSETNGLLGTEPIAALAICYELSVHDHAARAFENGAEIYLASVAKHVESVNNATARLREIARNYSMTVLMANAVGRCDGGQCAGRSSAWSTDGTLLAQLDDAGEGVIVVDTQTQNVNQFIVESD